MSCCGGNCGCGSGCSLDKIKKPDPIAIPDDFLCPISLDLMRDPVIVATGHTYERSLIQRWIDSGKATCPKTQQKLENFTLIPNYALRSLITQWCAEHNVEQPTGLTNGKMKKGILIAESGDIPILVKVLRNGSMKARENAAATLCSLSRGFENRITIGESGAIPALVALLQDGSTRVKKGAATALSKLCIYQGNKDKAVRAGIISTLSMLTDPSNCMVDEALTLKSVLDKSGTERAKRFIN